MDRTTHPEFDGICDRCGEDVARCRAFPGGCEHRVLTHERRQRQVLDDLARLDPPRAPGFRPFPAPPGSPWAGFARGGADRFAELDRVRDELLGRIRRRDVDVDHEHCDGPTLQRAMLAYADEYGLAVEGRAFADFAVKRCVDENRCIYLWCPPHPARRFHVDALVLVDEP